MMSLAPNGTPLSGPESVNGCGLTCTQAWIRWSFVAIVSRHRASPRARASGEARSHSERCSGVVSDTAWLRCSGRHAEERQADRRNLLDVAVIGPAASTHHVEMPQSSLHPGVVATQLDRIADVEHRGLVQLGVALP